MLESISFPDPVFSLAIEPKTRLDKEKLGLALQRLSEEDPTFRIRTNHETNQTIIAGMGELHLEILVDRMFREFKVAANVGAPQVAYKETIKKKAQGEGKYIRQTGGRGQYGHCLLLIEPKAAGEGYEFINKIKGGTIPGEFIPAIEKGVKEALEKGIYAGYPMVDLSVTVYDGSYHDVDSSEIAFKIAGSMALQDAVKQADPTILEPIMKMEVTTPDEFLGSIIGDLSSKRAQILGTEARGTVTIITAHCPLSELTGYATTTRSLTQGRATFYMEPSHYAEVPKNLQEKLRVDKTN
jgi:elongation factor G